MAVREDPFGERYDDRFVCRWHIEWEDGMAARMFWCGLDCPTQREQVARENLAAMAAAHELPVASPYFEQVRQWAKAQEAAR